MKRIWPNVMFWCVEVDKGNNMIVFIKSIQAWTYMGKGHLTQEITSIKLPCGYVCGTFSCFLMDVSSPNLL